MVEHPAAWEDVLFAVRMMADLSVPRVVGRLAMLLKQVGTRARAGLWSGSANAGGTGAGTHQDGVSDMRGGPDGGDGKRGHFALDTE